MARKSFSLDHFRAFVKLLDTKSLSPEAFGKAIAIGRSGVFQRLREFRQRGWISGVGFDDARATPEGRAALEADDAAPLDRAQGAKGRSKTDPPAPSDLRWVLSAPPATIGTLRRAHATSWGPSFLAELAHEPAPAPPRRGGDAPKPRDLIDLLDLPRELVVAVLHLLDFPWGCRLLERIELEPAKGSLAAPDRAAVADDRDPGGGSVPLPARPSDAERAIPIPAPKPDPNAHFNVVARDGSTRSSHADLGEAKRAMLRDAKGMKIVRRADGKVMATKDKPR